MVFGVAGDLLDLEHRDVATAQLGAFHDGLRVVVVARERRRGRPDRAGSRPEPLARGRSRASTWSGGLGGGFGFNGADVFYGNYSVGLGYDFRLFKAVGLGAEARWVGLTQGGNEGVQVGVRLGGGMRRKAATAPRPASTTSTSSSGGRAGGGAGHSTGDVGRGDGAGCDGDAVRLGRQQRQRVRLLGVDSVFIRCARGDPAEDERRSGEAGDGGREESGVRWRRGTS